MQHSLLNGMAHSVNGIYHCINGMAHSVSAVFERVWACRAVSTHVVTSAHGQKCVQFHADFMSAYRAIAHETAARTQ